MEVTVAIDYGAARVGVAASAGWMARPVTVLPRAALPTLLDQLRALAKQEMASLWLVGLPVNADGSEGEQAQATRAFARALANAVPEPVFLWNEYGSSQRAQQRMIEMGTSRKARRDKLDAWAAAVFLQDWIEQGGTGAERVWPGEPPADPADTLDSADPNIGASNLPDDSDHPNNVEKEA